MLETSFGLSFFLKPSTKESNSRYLYLRVTVPDENKTIGIILCQNKSEAVVEFTLPENNQQIFASKYMTVLPSKESLAKIIKY